MSGELKTGEVGVDQPLTSAPAATGESSANDVERKQGPGPTQSSFSSTNAVKRMEKPGQVEQEGRDERRGSDLKR